MNFNDVFEEYLELYTEGKEKGLDGKACWDGYKLQGTKKKGGKTVDNCVKSDDEEHSEDNEVAKKIGKGALKLAGKAALGAAKLAGKGALKAGKEIGHFVTADDFRGKRSDEEVEDCETCGCEENPEYGHFNDTYSKYIDQYEAEDAEYVNQTQVEAGDRLSEMYRKDMLAEIEKMHKSMVGDGIDLTTGSKFSEAEVSDLYRQAAESNLSKYRRLNKQSNGKQQDRVDVAQSILDNVNKTQADNARPRAEDGERVDKDRMKCNSPRRTSGGSKKFVVKACKDGKEKVVRFGDPNMKIKKSNPKRRKSFRARHKCDQKKDKFSAGYWSCKKW